MNAPNPPSDREIVATARRVIDRSSKTIEHHRKRLIGAIKRINAAKAKEVGGCLSPEYGDNIAAKIAEAVEQILGDTAPKRRL